MHLGQKKNLSVITLLSFFLAFFFLSFTAKAENTVAYEPQVTQLEGKIVRATFPGKPNYTSIKDGDEPESFWIFRPTKPFNVAGKPKDNLYPAENDVKEVQLVLDPSQYKRWQHLCNIQADVIIIGTLFHGVSGHHHTPVLMIVTDIRQKPSHNGKKPIE